MSALAADWVGALRQAARSRTPWTGDPAGLSCGLAEAYEMQAEHLRSVLADTRDSVIGTKLGVTTAEALERLGLDAPLMGPILRDRAHRSGVSLPRAGFLACIVEAEIGLLLGEDLDGRGGAPARATLVDAIAAMFPAIEIADSRYARWAEAPACAIVADLSYAGAWVRGADCPNWRALDLPTLPVTLRADGVLVREGTGGAVLGDPLHALAVAVAEAASRGFVLRAGSVVSTGTCIAPWIAPQAGHFGADFGPLGRVELALT